MPTFNQHCSDCLKILGDRHEQVNLWLDDLQKVYGYEHRKFRHTLEGIEQIREMFGDEGVKAAEVHILRDMCAIPKDTKDYEHGCFLDWKYYGEHKYNYPPIEE